MCLQPSWSGPDLQPAELALPEGHIRNIGFRCPGKRSIQVGGQWATVQLADLTFMWLVAALFTVLWGNARNVESLVIHVSAVAPSG